MSSAAPGGFSRQQRLRRSGDFRRLQRVGRRIAGPSFVVLFTLKGSGSGDDSPQWCRLGITVSRKVGNAVVRNRVKRRIREWFRRSRSEFGGIDELVVIARSSAAALSAGETAALLSRMVRSAGAGR